MQNTISFSKAVEGYLIAVSARHLSEHTIKDYLNTFRKLADFMGNDPPISEITHRGIRNFLAEQTVSKKTISNYHIGLSALWTWAVNEELVEDHILRKVIRPRPEKRVIKPYRESDVKAMLSALRYSKPYFRPGKVETNHRLRYEEES